MQPEQVIKRPIFMTEKGNTLRDANNQYLFEVDQNANKVEIKTAVETLFKVNVVNVNTMIMRGKFRRMGRGFAKTRNWKKAIVTLSGDDTIDFFEGA